jgi:ATP-dependent Zn protease
MSEGGRGSVAPHGRGALLATDERWICAYHESGHAVVGTLLGYRVRDVEIFVHAPGEGLKALTRYGKQRKRPEPWADVAVSLAGPLAEATAGHLLEKSKT